LSGVQVPEGPQKLKNMNISVKELKDINEKKEKFLLLDVRTDAEVSKAVIPINSIHIPMNLIPEKLNTFNKNDNIIVYCKSGVRSKKVCEFLKANDFNNVKNLEGGILAWAQTIDSDLLIKLL
tara:strand:- start:556 stop:924 length:369 start_codon:yes stop_codon:yes gene_type:complete